MPYQWRPLPLHIPSLVLSMVESLKLARVLIEQVTARLQIHSLLASVA